MALFLNLSSCGRLLKLMQIIEK